MWHRRSNHYATPSFTLQSEWLRRHRRTVNYSTAEELHCRLKTHLLQRWSVRLKTKPVERLVPTFERHVVRYQWQVTTVDRDVVQRKHRVDFLANTQDAPEKSLYLCCNFVPLQPSVNAVSSWSTLTRNENKITRINVSLKYMSTW